MAIIGNIDPWAGQFPQDQIEQVVQLICDSWPTFTMPAKRLEVPITQKLCAHLRRNRDRSIQWFRIDCETSILDAEGQITGRIDLRFTQGLDENVYFSLECKRLRVRSRKRIDTLADKYVTQGMLRYFTGQYARGLGSGGMLAYVMDGETEAAVQNVAESIHRNRIPLHMASDDTLRISSLSPQHARETRHRYGPHGLFVVYHVFLSGVLARN
jgi:hypothetical protein